MDPVELSVMLRGATDNSAIQPCLDAFEERTGTPTRLQLIEWGKGRSDLVKIALYHQGPDVSEIGTTWLNDLVAMNALRPFTESEVNQIGPASAFLPAAWKTTHVDDSPEVWSIPWLTESLILHYRKDILHTVGIDEAEAFTSLERLTETVQKLRAAGYPLPIAVPPPTAHALIVHVAASWVWGAGGDFMSADGRQVAFTEPAALAGFQAYFRMLRSISPEGMQILSKMGIPESFQRGHAPLAISGPWLQPRLAPPGSVAVGNWGVTRIPAPPFVGGSNLVVWKHTRMEKTSLALIRHLTSTREATRYGDFTGILSAREDGLFASSYLEDPFLKTLYESIQNGRSLPAIPLWALVEERLINTMVSTWDQLNNDPQLDVDQTVEQSLQKLARLLNMTLSQR